MRATLNCAPRDPISIIISGLEGFINRLRPIECKLPNKTGKSFPIVSRYATSSSSASSSFLYTPVFFFLFTHSFHEYSSPSFLFIILLCSFSHFFLLFYTVSPSYVLLFLFHVVNLCTLLIRRFNILCLHSSTILYLIFRCIL